MSLEQAARPVMLEAERRLVACQACGAQFNVDLVGVRAEFSKCGPGETLHQPCPRCHFHLDLRPLISGTVGGGKASVTKKDGYQTCEDYQRKMAQGDNASCDPSGYPHDYCQMCPIYAFR